MLHRRTTPRTPALAAVTAVAAAAAAVLALAGCGPDAAAKSDGKPSVVAPGKPGEPAKTLSAEDARKAVGDDRPNSADFSYVQRMIEHHGQALEMTALAPKQAGSTQVKRLAGRIAAAQGPEIKAMRGWLKQHGGARDSASPGKHDHGTMPGMATPKQLDALRAAKGEDFDRLFVKLMTTHHQGAITMATEVLSEGNNVLVEEMANDVIAQQTSEIHRMQGMS